MILNPEMMTYYNQRARQYEKVYQRPERQFDILGLSENLKSKLSNRRVLEVACGTGYWTNVIGETAQFVLASDQSAETLEVARAKKLSRDKVRFIQDDAFTLQNSQGKHTAGFAGFWWSHIPKSQIRDFLVNFHSKLSADSKVIFIDNQFVEGNSTPISRKDGDGNTYQIRTLEDGSFHEVLKNFPTDDEFSEVLSGIAKNIEITRSDYFWMLEYNLTTTYR